ncbi:MAG: amidohydrolase family protein [Burkholderiales bacterium]|nr:amidohydrolase family protein [Burkholderiales bacterium]
MRIDAHQHFWRIAERAGAWPPPTLASIHRDFGPQDLAPLLQAGGIDGTVLVQSMPSVAETRQLLELARATTFVRGVVGWVDMKATDAVDTIAQLARDPLLKGLRPMLQDLEDDDWIADPATAPAAEAMARHGLVFDALVLPRQLGALRTFAARHPRLAVVVDHAAKPPIARGQMQPWHDDLASLAALPQVHCKVSGLLTEAGERTRLEDLLPYVQTLWACFGPSRLLWGSDWPVLRLAGDYPGWLAMTTALLAAVQPAASAGEAAAILGGNAVSLYRLRAPRPC